MKNITGFYPRLRVDTSRVSAVGQAGGVLLTETIRASGLDVALSEALGRWRKPTAVYDPARIVSDLAVTLALGGDCLADIALIRSEPGVYGRVASDPTVLRIIDVLAADVDTALKAIDFARAKARATVWGLTGEHAPDHGCDAASPLIGTLGPPRHRRLAPAPSPRRPRLNTLSPLSKLNCNIRPVGTRRPRRHLGGCCGE